jgi:UDP-N-acetyl-D-glucosamine dehydrogenase
MGIDVHEVLDAADTKPFGFMKFTPGPGLGGHCIPIDPFYLTWKAREFEQDTRFIELAGQINTAMPKYVVQKTIEALNTQKKSINGSKILLIGLAYKPDVDDDRESPTYKLMDYYSDLGAEITYYDPFVPVIKKSREHAHWAGKKSIEWTKEMVASADVVVISTNHTEINYEQIAEWSQLIVDTRNSIQMSDKHSGKVFKA